jgi:hypothetical protein
MARAETAGFGGCTGCGLIDNWAQPASAGSTSNVNTRFDVADSRRTIHRGTATICTSHSEERMKITSVPKLFRIQKRAKLRTKFMSQDSGWHINLSVFSGRQSTLPLHSSAYRQEKRNGPDPSRLSGVAHAAIIIPCRYAKSGAAAAVEGATPDTNSRSSAITSAAQRKSGRLVIAETMKSQAFHI